MGQVKVKSDRVVGPDNRNLKIDVYVKRQTASEVFEFTTLL